MISFDGKDRKRVFGVYSGCPCSVRLSSGFSTQDKDMRPEDFNGEVEKLILEWRNQCEKYVAGPTVGARITENWRRSIKLPYGKYAHIPCVYDQNSGKGRYCKFSLKEEESDPEGIVHSKRDDERVWAQKNCDDL